MLEFSIDWTAFDSKAFPILGATTIVLVVGIFLSIRWTLACLGVTKLGLLSV